MDERLRILKRLSLHDPESKERYIAELERAVGGVKRPESLGESLLEIQTLANKLEEIIVEKGIRYDSETIDHLYSDSECYFLPERTEANHDGVRTAYGVALALGTREVAAAIVKYYGMHAFKTWSAEPVVFLEHPDTLFLWEVVLNG